MVNVAPGALVEGAVRQPLSYGLFSTFSLRPASGDRWEAGVQFELGTCDPVDGIGQWQCDPADTIGLPKNLDTNTPEVGEASPFTVYGHFQCSPVGWSVEQANAYADTHLTNREEARVERAFWTGDLGNVPNLQGEGKTQQPDDVTPTAGTAVSPVLGLGLLEDAIASTYGSAGVIHLTRAAAMVSMQLGALQISGGRLTTALGTAVAAGAGYPGTGPEGEAVIGTHMWMYASPALFGYRSEIFHPSSTRGDLLDRSTNDLYAVAERSYLLGFDPCGVFAVLVDLAL